MSGHSKWAKIKRAKGAKDIKKGALFTKLGKNITIAAKEGGGDPGLNFALRLAVDKAKAANMPSDSIERAIGKGTGAGADKDEIKKISYEAFAHGGASIIIDCQTDNTNRTISEVKKMVESHGAKMAEIGSVAWKFSENGLIVVIPAKLVKSEKYGQDDYYVPVDIDEVEMELFGLDGISDVERSEVEREDGSFVTAFEVVTPKTEFAKVVGAVEKLNLQVHSAELVKIAADKVSLSEEDKEKVGQLVEALEEHDDVDVVWSDIA